MQFIPAPLVQADHAASSTPVSPDEQGAAAVLEVGLGEAEGFLNA
jgi:hypothetical protein